MLQQNSEYWICFSLLRLEMLDEVYPFEDELFTIYQIEIVYSTLPLNRREVHQQLKSVRLAHKLAPTNSTSRK